MAEAIRVSTRVAGVLGFEEIEPIYRRGIWAVTPWARSDTDFVVTHVPSGMGVCKLPDMCSDAAINFCRKLADAFPDHAEGAAFGSREAATPDLRAFVEREHERLLQRVRRTRARATVAARPRAPGVRGAGDYAMRATTLPPPRLAITVSLSCQSLGPVDRLVRDCAYADATGFTLRAPEPPPVRVRCHRETRRVRGRKSHS